MDACVRHYCNAMIFIIIERRRGSPLLLVSKINVRTTNVQGVELVFQQRGKFGALIFERNDDSLK